jgi:hypothetical protein
MRRILILFALLLLAAAPAQGWGNHGHRVINGAAAKALSGEQIPAFLKNCETRLAYLGPEPDRWRIRDLDCLNRGAAPDHFLDLEWTKGVDPENPPRNRHEFGRLVARNLQKPPDKVGYAPYRVVELCQRIEAGIAALALIEGDDEVAAAERTQAKENVIYTAGVLGHYVADLSNPHHTTIHYNGWTGANPEGFPTDQGAHWRFESAFVERVKAAMTIEVTAPARTDLDYTREIWALVVESNGLVPDLYRLDRDGAFTEGNEKTKIGLRGLAFAQARMIRGATLLRDLWASACARGKRRADSEVLRQQLKTAFKDAGLELRVSVTLERFVKVWGGIRKPEDGDRAREIVDSFAAVTGSELRLRTLY